ncbi:type I-E CRISPR-associated protein Cse1/CasA [Streptomyces triculaminicus]|uniref:Type I-E CRISPR-associated protein Cse1/CasA n=1 Tax=Streptomyces triculaminicus TaxID=2816232 RepID=A0A939FSE9_9ACTN|nr:type I-E CRISPR-associated protein Cse1/CasA [Streptomyces triculaminicus]MBO0657260.1 type I-E CRISPR-associated protein Cse1/CasA [Streptomyces triculaminicus]
MAFITVMEGNLPVWNAADQPCLMLVLREDADREELEALLPGVAPGAHYETGLRGALLGAHLASDLEVPNPAVESMLRRLLTALAIRVGRLDVADLSVWEDRFDTLLAVGRFDAKAVNDYIDRWRHRFDLYDSKRPFLQDPRLAEQCSRRAAPGKLVMPRPSGANQPWLDHTPQDEPVPSGEALGWVLAWRGYGPSGTGAQRQHGGVNSKNMKAAPLRSLVSFHPLGTSLFTSLLLSCPPPTGTEDVAGDLAPWERDELEDPLLPAPAKGPVSLLTGRTAHHVLLAPDESGGEAVGCWVAWGSRVDLPAARDPFVVDRVKAGPVRASWRRSLLRDFDSFIHAKDPAAVGIKGVILPGWLSVYADLPQEALKTLSSVRVRALGCHQEKQDRNEHWYGVTTPASIAPYLPSRHPQRAARVAQTRLAAEMAAADMAKSLRSAWKQMSPGEKTCPWADEGTAQFWDRAESLFWAAISDDDAPPVRFRALALEIYDAITQPVATTPQGMHPIAQARSALAYPRTGRKKEKAA